MSIWRAAGSATGRFDFGERPQRQAKLFWRLGSQTALLNGHCSKGPLTAVPRNSGGWEIAHTSTAVALRRVMAVYEGATGAARSILDHGFDIQIAMLHKRANDESNSPR